MSHGNTISYTDERPNFKLGFPTRVGQVINIYASNTNAERHIYFHSISTFTSLTEDNISGGDFNCITDKKLDKLGGNPFERQSAITILNTIMQQHSLKYIWRDRNRDVKNLHGLEENTFFIILHYFTHTCIDKFFISSSLTPFVIIIIIIKMIISQYLYRNVQFNRASLNGVLFL